MTTNTISLLARLADGETRPATGDEIIAATRETLSHRVRRGVTLTSPKATRDFLALKLSDPEFESFCGLFLESLRL